ncbi:MAG: hypothetical protein IT282_12870 [Bacteroidetes bacterium]|nr:hypothetical protein [Bacteroidota bacterium]
MMLNCRPAGGLLLSFGVALALASAQPATAQHDILSNDGFVMTHWGTKEGLPSNDAGPIIQSREGYVWIGTGFGIVRFDGVRFTSFNSKNTPAFVANEVRTIHEDATGRLWIGLHNGGVLLYENNTFSSPAFLSPLAFTTVTSIFSDSLGSLYFCGRTGVFRVRDTSGSFIQGLPEHPAFGFTGSDSRVYLIGSSIVQITPDGSIHNLGGYPDRISIPHVIQESDQTLLAVKSGELRRFYLRPDGSVDRVESFRTPGATRLLADDNDGVFVGTQGYGILHLKGTRFTQPHGLRAMQGAGRTVHSFMLDTEGGLWATTGGGVYRFIKSFFSVIGHDTGLENDYTWNIHYQKDGTLWVGVGMGGTYRLKDGKVVLLTMNDGMPDDHVTEMIESSDGRMWFGGVNGNIVTLKNGVRKRIDNLPGYRRARVLSIAEDSQRRIWIGTRNGLHALQDGSFLPYPKTHPQDMVSVRNIIPDPNGDLWCVSSGRVTRLRNDSVTTFAEREERMFYGTTAVMLDSGRVWYGTYGGGLYLIRGDSVIRMQRVYEGFGPRIIAIHEDRQGFLWINAERELQRVRKADLLAAVDAQEPHVNVEVYNDLDGLANIEFNNASLSSAQQLEDGRLLYASTTGVIVVNPDAAGRSITPPPVMIEGIVADGTFYGTHAMPQLPPGTARVDIQFTALRFQSPGRVQISYQLSGVDKDWIVSDGSTRSITYANPGYGEFTFLVAASANGGPWSPDPARITFTIAPHFYQRPLVQIGSVFALAALLFVGHRIRTARILRRTRALEEEIHRRRKAEEELRRSLDEKTVLLKEIHHRVKNNMQVISSLISLQMGNSSDPLLRETLKESQSRIRSMALVHETLYRSNNLAAINFREYIRLLVSQVTHANLKRNVRVVVEETDVTLPLDQAVPAGLIMNELYSNALKHAFPDGEEGVVTVAARKDNNGTVELVVADTGVGMPAGADPKKAATLGFHLINSLTEQIGGTLTITRDPGTTVTVRFPSA